MTFKEENDSKHDSTRRFKLVYDQLVRLIVGEKFKYYAQLRKEVHLILIKINHFILFLLLHLDIALLSFVHN